MDSDSTSPAKGDDIVPQPVEVDDSDIGAGASTGVWVTGLLSVVFLLLLIFGLG